MSRLSGETPPLPAGDNAYWREVGLYRPGRALVEMMEAAITLRQPLLLTGDAGSGKTMAAYWAAWRLGLGPERLFHVQVRSETTAAALKYEFDAVRYLREAEAGEGGWEASRRRFLRPGPLWRAFDAARSGPVVLLLDEIDKAPRDVPNDLLDEFERWSFEVPDALGDDGTPLMVSARGGPDDAVTFVVITSNGERQLPNAMLRRCVHYHLEMDDAMLRDVVEVRSGALSASRELIEGALLRFTAIRETHGLRYRPGTSELLSWLRVLATAEGAEGKVRNQPLHALPYLGVVVKDPVDRELLSRRGL